MKKLITIVLLTISLSAAAQVSLTEARKLFFGMDKNECNALELSNAFDKNPPRESLLIAYHGASAAASPACISNPAKKLSNFKKGKQLLESAVKSTPDNLEIRFLRYATQSKAPSFLGYNADVNNDKKYILNNLKAFGEKDGNKGLQRQIGNFMINSGNLTADEQSGIRKIMN